MIGVVAHDAGGAEVVSSYIRRNNIDCQFCLAGPAVDVFQRKFGHVENRNLDDVVTNSDRLLCGTSLSADLEYLAIKLARQKQIKSISILDHWVNYRRRFFRNGEWCFPDEIWAGDKLSCEKARSCIPEVPVLLVPNAYFLDLYDEFSEACHSHQDRGLNLLYVCEPFEESADFLSGDNLYWGHTDKQVLEYFFSKLQPIYSEINSIVLRPHPREPVGKYDWVRNAYDLPISVTAKNMSLNEEIIKSDVVAGGGTMAMVVALIAGKRVVCTLPPESKVARLPHEEITSMVDFVKDISEKK